MYQTSVKKLASKSLLALAVMAVAGSALAQASTKQVAKTKSAELVAPVGGALTVSDKELNTFTFGSSVKRIFFPAGSPVVGEPIYLAEGSQVMLQFARSEDSLQMVVELNDGSVTTLRVLPRPVQGVAHSVGSGKRYKPAAARMSAEGPTRADPRAEDIAMLRQVVQGDIPADFTPVDLPKPTKFDKFTVIPMAGWSDGANKRAYVFQLVANQGQVALVAAPQFYRAGITAVMLDGDVVDEKTAPMLYVLEEVADE